MSDLYETSFDNAIEAVEFAIDLLDEVLVISEQYKEPKYIKKYSLKYYLPFSFEKTSMKNVYMLANKHYTPLGYFERQHFDYSKYTSLHVHLSNEELLSVIKEGSKNTLWDSPHTPLDSASEAYEYLGRLKRLVNILKSKK